MMLSELSEIQLDALREISGIGAGHAATALSDLVGRVVRLEVPTIEILDIAEVPGIFGGAEEPAGAAFASIEGRIGGGVLAMGSPETLASLLEMLGETSADSPRLPDEKLAGILAEVARRLFDSHLTAVSDMTGLASHASDVVWAYDMAGALLEAVVAEIGSRADQALLVRTAFIDANRTVEAAFFFVPAPESLAAILSSLGLA
jgi:chemotaxis protein CheC